MKFNIFISCLLILLICASCSDVSSPTPKDDLLVGNWSETFTYSGIMGEVTQTSTLSFTESNFQVIILPQLHSFAGDSDTLYIGTYYVSEDTLIFHEEDITKKMRYNIQNDSLYLSNIEIVCPENDSLIFIECSSFIWGNATFKMSGTFLRIE